MTTKYVVVYYLPHPLSGERLNLGVIAWGQGRIAARFIRNWNRIRIFGREDVEFLRDFVHHVEEATSLNLQLPGMGEGELDEGQIQKMLDNWIQSIQFSEPRSSLKSPQDLLEEVAPIFLPELPHVARRGRDHRSAAKIVTQQVFEVLYECQCENINEIVKRSHCVSGRLDEHTFDVVVSNGRLFFAAQGLSFESSQGNKLKKDVDATAWAVDDVRSRYARLPVAVFALSPTAESGEFRRAKRIFNGLRADVLGSEREMRNWVIGAAEKIPTCRAQG